MALRNGPVFSVACGLSEWAVPGVLAFLRGTTHVRVVGDRAIDRLLRRNLPAVGAFWHHQAIVCALLFSRVRSAIMVSRSKDGEIAARALSRTRVRAVRGSSSRGGHEALGELVGLLDGGWRIGFAADGPRGPSRELKAGAVVAACRAGVPIIPMAAAAHPHVRLRSWDRTVIPLPGARAVIRLDDPIDVPRDASHDEIEALRLRVEARMRGLEDECLRLARC